MIIILLWQMLMTAIVTALLYIFERWGKIVFWAKVVLMAQQVPKSQSVLAELIKFVALRFWAIEKIRKAVYFYIFLAAGFAVAYTVAVYKLGCWRQRVRQARRTGPLRGDVVSLKEKA